MVTKILLLVIAIVYFIAGIHCFKYKCKDELYQTALVMGGTACIFTAVLATIVLAIITGIIKL
jgi:hypothetical protein